MYMKIATCLASCRGKLAEMCWPKVFLCSVAQWHVWHVLFGCWNAMRKAFDANPSWPDWWIDLQVFVKQEKCVPRVRIELTTLGLWDLRAAYCAIEAQLVGHHFRLLGFTALSVRARAWRALDLQLSYTLESVVQTISTPCKTLLTPQRAGNQSNKSSLSTGFEPVRGDPNGFQVHRLNHSATTALKFQLTLQFLHIGD